MKKNKKPFYQFPIYFFKNTVMRQMVKNSSALFISLLLICSSWCLMLTSSSCNDDFDGEITFPRKDMALVYMVNESAEEVHMWINPCSGFDGETINPGNKLESDEKRHRNILFYFETETTPVTLSISMGQNGKTLKTVTCPIEPGGAFLHFITQQFYATWDGETGKIILYDGAKYYYSN